jgi:hypothetical protein
MISSPLQTFYDVNHELLISYDVELLKSEKGPMTDPYWSYVVYKYKNWHFLCYFSLRDDLGLYVSDTYEGKDEIICDKPNDKIWIPIYRFTQPERYTITDVDQIMDIILATPTNTLEEYSEYLGNNLKTFIKMVEDQKVTTRD